MTDQVRVIVSITARPEAVKDIESIVLELGRASRKEAGCLRYEVLRNNADPRVFVLYEEWTSNVHLDAHNKTAHFAKAVTTAQPYLARPLEVGRYSAIF